MDHMEQTEPGQAPRARLMAHEAGKQFSEEWPGHSGAAATRHPRLTLSQNALELVRGSV